MLPLRWTTKIFSKYFFRFFNPSYLVKKFIQTSCFFLVKEIYFCPCLNILFFSLHTNPLCPSIILSLHSLLALAHTWPTVYLCPPHLDSPLTPLDLLNQLIAFARTLSSTYSSRHTTNHYSRPARFLITKLASPLSASPHSHCHRLAFTRRRLLLLSKHFCPRQSHFFFPVNFAFDSIASLLPTDSPLLALSPLSPQLHTHTVSHSIILSASSHPL